MIPAALKTAIFSSLPKTVTVDSDALNVEVEYAEKVADVQARLASTGKPVLLTLRYFADRRSEGESPTDVLGRTTQPNGAYEDIVYERGERRLVTLSLSIHALDVETPHYHDRSDVVEAYATALQTWLLKDLPAVLEQHGAALRGSSPVADLTFLAGGSMARRSLDLFLIYTQSFQEVVTTIESEEIDASTQPQ